LLAVNAGVHLGNELLNDTVNDRPTEVTEGETEILNSLAIGLPNTPPGKRTQPAPVLDGHGSNPSFSRQLPGRLGLVPNGHRFGNGARPLATPATGDTDAAGEAHTAANNTPSATNISAPRQPRRRHRPTTQDSLPLGQPNQPTQGPET
jgi:hypothetical protein